MVEKCECAKCSDSSDAPAAEKPTHGRKDIPRERKSEEERAAGELGNIRKKYSDGKDYTMWYR